MRVREVKNRLNARQRWAVVFVDVLLLVELTWCMYVSQQDLATMTPHFLKLFVPMLVGTFVLARVLIRLLRSPDATPESAPGEAAPASS
jgi:hypothetical protein